MWADIEFICIALGKEALRWSSWGQATRSIGAWFKVEWQSLRKYVRTITRGLHGATTVRKIPALCEWVKFMPP